MEVSWDLLGVLCGSYELVLRIEIVLEVLAKEDGDASPASFGNCQWQTHICFEAIVRENALSFGGIEVCME